MKKLLIVWCLGILMFSCSSIHKCNENSMSIPGKVIERKVNRFTEIPAELLDQIQKMGIDSSLVLNEYEGRYLNYIFETNSLDFDMIGKQVAFMHPVPGKLKIDFFKDERERFYHDETPVAGVSLYIFDAIQKEESGGYDAAIEYWSKFIRPIERVVKRLKDKR